MSTTQLTPIPVFRVYDNSGNLAIGGSISTFAAGTSTPIQTFTDFTGNTANTNPIILNSRGECQIWLNPALSYKFTAFDINNNQLWSVDHINASNTANTPILTQVSSGQIYTSNGAIIDRLNDRVFVGSATVNDGNIFSGSTGNQDYVSINIPQNGTTSLSQLASESSVGGIGAIFGTRSSDNGGSTTGNALGMMSVAINDQSSNPVIGEAGYFEAQKKTNAGITTTLEIDSVNQSGTTPNYDPYTNLASLNSGQTFGLNIAAGGARTGLSTSSAAMITLANGTSFNKGIVFSNNSIGSSEVISLPQSTFMQWYTSASQQLGTSCTTTLGSKSIFFTATAFTPYVGQILTFSDGTNTFTSGTFITSVVSATNVIVSNAAGLTNGAGAGLIMSGQISQRTNSIQATSATAHQDQIVFTDTGTVIGSCPNTNGGLNCTAVIKAIAVSGGTNYVTVTASTTTPLISTPTGNLFVGSGAGPVFIGNTVGVPSIQANGPNCAMTTVPNATVLAGGNANQGIQLAAGGPMIIPGSGAPTVSAPQGSLYLRTDGNSTSTRAYINTNGSTTWTAITTVA